MTADAFYDPTRGFAGGPRLISFDPIEVSSSPGGSLPEGITRNIRAAEVRTGVDLTRANHDKTVHRSAGPAKSASSLLPKRR
jgi:hypothetical protein